MNKLSVFQKNVFCFSALFILGMGLYAQDRGLKVIAADNLGQQANVGKQYSLFIAIDAYRFWPALKKPVADAREIRKILEDDYYLDKDGIIELYNQNATKEKIIETFENLQNKLTVHDSLFIYFAGHGHLDEASKQGFWIPVDGGTNRRAQENWLPNNQVRGYIAGLKTIHVFLVSDACFSGDILNTTRALLPQIDNAYFSKAYSLTSRQVLTSGSNETVPDQSEFSEALKNCLRKNTAPLLDPISIYNDVRLAVRSTTPLYGTLNAANHQEGATFIFFRKPFNQTASVQPAPPVASAPETNPPSKPQYPTVMPDDGSGKKKAKTTADKASRLWTVGASVGSSFAAPWVIGTVHATLAPFNNSFLEIGSDLGFMSGDPNVGYFYLCPFAHYAFFMPFESSGGWYIGAGGGYMQAEYDFSGEKVPLSILAADLTAGVNVMNIFDISYTLRTDFATVSNKVSVGYTYRFK
jgi:hypothetical protein